MRIGLRQLEAFVLVADRLSFRAAADGLNTTQPNISSRIASLEEALGYAVFERGAGPVALTPRGLDLLEHARKVLSAHETFLDVAGNAQLLQGGLRLGVTEMIAHSWLGAYLVRLKEELPNVSIDLVVDVSANLSPQIYNRSLDLALQSAPFDRKLDGAVALGAYSLIWVASPNLGVTGKELSLDALQSLPILTHARGTLPYDQLVKYLAKKDLKAQLVPSSNLAACLKMTSDGLGIACLPRVMVAEELERGRLQELNHSWHPDPLTFYARFEQKVSLPVIRKAAEIAGIISEQFSD